VEVLDVCGSVCVGVSVYVGRGCWVGVWR